MTAHDEDRLSPQEARVRAALLALPAAEADPAYRSRLRAQFTSGAIEAAGPAVKRLPPRAGTSWFAPALAAAACLAFVLVTFDRGPAWQVTRVRGAGTVLVGDRMVELSDAAGLSAALARGGRVRLPADGELEIVAPGSMAIDLARGSDVVVPPAPGRWFRRSARAEVKTGEAFITTGRDFHGARLTVTTEEATVEVVGTTFAVLRHEEGTCVCVMEGRVIVGAAGEEAVEVGAGLRRFCYPRALARASESAPILDYSVHALHELRASTARLLDR